MQAQTLSNATQPIGKIHPFNKIAINFKPIIVSFEILNALNQCKTVNFFDRKHYSKPFGLDCAVKLWGGRGSLTHSLIY